MNRAAALTGATLRPSGTEQLFFHRQTSALPNLAAQRLGALKYHRSITKTDPENRYTSVPLLFDLERDPTERFEASSTLSSFVPQLNAAANAHLASFHPPYPQVPPDASLVSGFAALAGTGSGSAPMQLRFTRAGDTLDSYYALEQSTDLVTWSASPLPGLASQPVALPDGSEQVTFAPPPPPVGANQVFYRLRVSLP
jgi:hypothetical protein